MVAKKAEAAADFQKLIHEGRDRKKNEALAARIFNKDRRSSTPQKAVAGGSLASRAGVKKRTSLNVQKTPAGNIDGEWTHDLHAVNSAPSTPLGGRGPKPLSLADRITSGNGAGAAAGPRQKRRAAQVAQALIRTGLAPRGSANASAAGGPFNKGISIRGLAGPYIVMAQNFAPGTTAADIESAMTPVGGLITSCRLLKTSPIVIAELVFESKEGAESVIARFDKQTADGRVLHVYPKVGGTSVAAPSPASRADRDSMVVDGTMGFDDPMDKGNVAPQQPASQSRGGLYSDNIVRGSTRRGRGFGRGGRGGGGGGR